MGQVISIYAVNMGIHQISHRSYDKQCYMMIHYSY